MQIYDILIFVGKTSTDEEKTDMLVNGLQGQLPRDVACLVPTTPKDFSVKAIKSHSI